ncbi:MAG: AAA family ATPase [Anaerolineales bacterium]|nr:AAA family ATPase [Anaerolineales bacterium]MCB8954073.1 AAA family ATPase [Ardenticatenales bacterium]
MTVQAIRLENFMAFADTNWIELRPIVLLFGRNSSGKSAIFRALRLLRQSLDIPANDRHLVFVTEHGVDLGSIQETIHKQELERELAFSFRCDLTDALDVLKTVGLWQGEPIKETFAELRLGFRWDDARQWVALSSFQIDLPWVKAAQEEGPTLFFAEEWSLDQQAERGERWYFSSDLLHGHESQPDSVWPAIYVEMRSGFMPQLSVVASQPHSPALQDVAAVQAVLDEVCHQVAIFLQQIEYLGPIRPEPERVFNLDVVTQQKWRQKGLGSYLDFLLDRSADAEIFQRLDEWLQILKLADRVDPEKVVYRHPHLKLSNVKFRELPGEEPPAINLLDVGYGASQVLPVLIHSLLARQGSLVVIEQPELHLHPGAQAQLGDLFVETVNPPDFESTNTVRFFLETHSEHLLLRLRRWVAETAANKGDLVSKKSWRLKPDQLAVYFVDRDPQKGESEVHPIQVKRSGEFGEKPVGFKDFFADDLKEAIALTLAGAEVD